MKSTPRCSIELLNMILEHLSTASESQIDKSLLEEILKFKLEDHTPSEKYDFIVSISKENIIKVTDKLTIGKISNFIKVLCELDKYYLKP